MPFEITPDTTQDKATLLHYFRERGNEQLEELRDTVGSPNYKKLASKINQKLRQSLDTLIEGILYHSQEDSWTKTQLLKSILTSTHCGQVAMLDLRNEVWLYEYMAFSRRIGELWEKFVRLPFSYPITDLKPVIPPLFSEVKDSLKQEVEEYINNLSLSEEQKHNLRQYYEKVWTLVDSGEISLQLDFHGKLEKQNLNIDFKSGFGSNEKGNTNRLLMVATIYQTLEQDYHNILLVRASENQNNNYFKLLKQSDVWEAYCGEEAYDKIGGYTGFDLKNWITQNINWHTDLLPETVEHLTNSNLLKYLEW